jgi:hypothetical protein
MLLFWGLKFAKIRFAGLTVGHYFFQNSMLSAQSFRVCNIGTDEFTGWILAGTLSPWSRINKHRFFFTFYKVLTISH